MQPRHEPFWESAEHALLKQRGAPGHDLVLALFWLPFTVAAVAFLPWFVGVAASSFSACHRSLRVERGVVEFQGDPAEPVRELGHLRRRRRSRRRS